jgi:ADP-ribosyl-[dinitrogen reductase] hydrolase
LFGAACGVDAIPKRWLNVIDNCEPDPARPDVNRPRPRAYWPNDTWTLAEQLLDAGIKIAIENR